MRIVRTGSLWLLLAAALAACGGDATGPRFQGTFTLRAVVAPAPPYAPVPVPASLAGYTPGDTTRWLEGSFTLNADGTWHERLEQQMVFGGVAQQARVIETGNRYRVTGAGRGRYLLELFPDQPVVAAAVAVYSSTAVLSRDTLYIVPGVFVR